MIPKVSVPIATYNRANYLSACLDSILAQTYKNIEIVVVDDGSTDNTGEVARRYGDRILYVPQEHRGNIATYYHARSLCTGKYLTYFGDDDVLGPNYIEFGVQILEGDPKIAQFCTDWYMIDSRGERIGGNTYLHSRAHMQSGKRGIDDLLKLGCFVHGGIARRDVFEKIGYYDETFSHACDYDMYLRMTGAGYFIYFVNEPLASYRIHPKMRSHNESEMWEETVKVLELNLRRFPDAYERLRHQMDKKLGMNKAWLAVRLFWEGKISKALKYATSATRDYLPAVPLGSLQMTYSALRRKRSVYQLGD